GARDMATRESRGDGCAVRGDPDAPCRDRRGIRAGRAGVVRLLNGYFLRPGDPSYGRTFTSCVRPGCAKARSAIASLLTSGCSRFVSGRSVSTVRTASVLLASTVHPALTIP